jgi:hypothetical protein
MGAKPASTFAPGALTQARFALNISGEFTISSLNSAFAPGAGAAFFGLIVARAVWRSAEGLTIMRPAMVDDRQVRPLKAEGVERAIRGAQPVFRAWRFSDGG